jgi:hypothetical protein
MASPVAYYIFLSDPAVVAAAQAANPNGLFIPPRQASTIYGAPIFDTDPPGPNGVGQVPFIAIDMFGGYTITEITLGAFFNQENFTIPANTLPRQPSAQPGYWVGYFILQGAPALPPSPTPKPPTSLPPTPPNYPPFTVTGPPARPMGARRWVDGFELPPNGEASGSGNGQFISRDAGRFADSYGFGLRNFAANVQRQHAHGVATLGASERFYVRVRTLPTGGDDNFWGTTGNVVGGTAGLMTISPAGLIKFYNKGIAAYPGTLLGNSGGVTLTPGVWYKFDIQYLYGTQTNFSPATFSPGFLIVAINGANVANFTIGGGGPATTDGLGAVQFTQSSYIGTDAGAGATHGLEMDVDDWIGANSLFAAAGNAGQTGIPLDTGSRVRFVKPSGFGSGHNGTAWVGDWKFALFRPWDNSISANGIVNASTSGAILQIGTTYTPAGHGVAAMVFSARVTAGAVNANDKVGALGTVVSNILSPYVWGLYTVPDGTDVTAFPDATNPVIQFQRGNLVTSLTLASIAAAAEEVGDWDTSDSPATPNPVPFISLHNAPYSQIVATNKLPPIAGVQTSAFQYTGNGTQLLLALQTLPHWYYVRNMTSGNTAGMWLSSTAVPQQANQGSQQASIVADIATPYGTSPDTTAFSQASAAIAGADAVGNQNAATYQVVLVSDPGMRYILNGAFSHGAAVASFVNNLADPTFTPDAVFFQLASLNGNASVATYYKGPGLTAAQIVPWNGTVNNNGATIGTGTLTTQTILHGSLEQPQTGYSCWRKNDGSGQTFFDCGSYTGNGAGGNRTIPCVLNGMSPRFAIVMSHAAAAPAFFRDPGHTSTHSNNTTGTDSTTAIVGGDINAIIVSTTLNANAVVYDYFVIQGCNAIAGSWDTTQTLCNPVDTIPRPTNGPFGPPPTPPPPLDAGCISFATAISELLFRLGDSGGVHWTVAECQRYLLESLRVWNAITFFSRSRGSFSTTAGQTFYDLPTVLPSLRAYTLKDADLVTDLEYQLEEPVATSTWLGTPMFNLSILTQVLQRRRDRFLFETGAVVTHETNAVTPDANGRVALVADAFTVRRAAWVSGGITTALMRDTEWGLNAYNRAWRTPVGASAVSPKAYSVGVTPPLTVQLAPPPTAVGVIDYLALIIGSTLNPAAGVLLGIPDDYAWVVKWGALGDLFNAPGPSNDPIRAKIAQTMWELGVKMSTRAAVVLDGIIATNLVRITGINEADTFKRSWQNTTGVPSTVLSVSQNLIGLSPVPDNLGPYTVTLDVVRNQPVPVLLTDCFFEGGVELTAALIDYAEFLARFKEGPEQAQEAMQLLESFLNETKTQEARDAAQMLVARSSLLDEGERSEVVMPSKAIPDPRERL